MAKPKATNGASKKGASKKSGTSKINRLVIGDPPILIGGGGSTYIWIRRELGPVPVNATLVDPVHGVKSGAPGPDHRAEYVCIKVGFDISNVRPNNGNADQTPSPVQNGPKHHVKFE